MKVGLKGTVWDCCWW